jgi:ATP phosphoribosyltransferase regulatory subunit HisZ
VANNGEGLNLPRWGYMQAEGISIADFKTDLTSPQFVQAVLKATGLQRYVRKKVRDENVENP